MIEVPVRKSNRPALIDDSDADRVLERNWYYIGRRYVATGGGKAPGGLIYLHRLILDAPPAIRIDHINGDRLDNRRQNLRFCTQSQNMGNRKPNRDGTSRFKGVYWSLHDKKWRAQICCAGLHVHIGGFLSEEEAARAYDAAALERFGEFAKVNFP
jgi:hypothetical protein